MLGAAGGEAVTSKLATLAPVPAEVVTEIGPLVATAGTIGPHLGARHARETGGRLAVKPDGLKTAEVAAVDGHFGTGRTAGRAEAVDDRV
jgi:hypothetical protein